MARRSTRAPGKLEARRWTAPIIDALDRKISDRVNRHLFRRDPKLLARLRPFAELLELYSSVDIRGWENLPQSGSFLLVANHSGGAESNDVAAFHARWLAKRGTDSELYTLAYDALFVLPGLGTLLPRLGVVPASHENARKALERGGAVLVFPGGDYEAFRPWRDRNRIDFGGRKGFVKLAIEAGVPVVPMTIHGAHESMFVLTRGTNLARRLGLNRVHVKILPLVLAVPVGISPFGLGAMRLPSKVTVQLGPPLDWSRYTAADAEDPEVLDRCYVEITGVMQSTLDSLHREHPHPIRERLSELRPRKIVRRMLRRA